MFIVKWQKHRDIVCFGGGGLPSLDEVVGSQEVCEGFRKSSHSGLTLSPMQILLEQGQNLIDFGEQ